MTEKQADAAPAGGVGDGLAAVTSFKQTLDAAASVATALDPLDASARQRVLEFVTGHFGLSLGAKGTTQRNHVDRNAGSAGGAERVQGRGNGDETPRDEGGPAQYELVAELFDAARPTGDKDRALVVAYWLQVCQGADHFFAQEVNTQLKHMGHAVGNITRAFESLKGEKPAPVIQLQKTGKAQQARKKFKVTAEGQKRVEQMISAASGNS